MSQAGNAATRENQSRPHRDINRTRRFTTRCSRRTAAIRPHWQALMDSISAMGPEGLASRWQEGRRLLHDNGVTYNVYGDPRSTDRPWPLDPLPLVIDEKEWAAIEAAMRQRATLLNALLADFYGPQRLLHEDLFPPGADLPASGISAPMLQRSGARRYLSA